MLRDARFRNALNYAVDRPKLAQLAYQGHAAPATSIMPPDTWTNPDYHWQPQADQAYPFDLAKANQLLDAAGYSSAPAACVSIEGKPISLRLWSTTDFPQAQTAAKLIAGWFQKLGLKSNSRSSTPGALHADMFNYKGGRRPRLRPLRRRLGGLRRPRPDAHRLDHGGDRRHQRTVLVRTPRSTR